VIVDAPAGGTAVRAAIDGIGDRLASGVGAGFAWLIADLHGNVAAQASGSGATLVDVLR
jgi:hypothetical protein